MESFDAGFSFLGLFDMNFERNDGLVDHLYNEIKGL
jgi:hypothetical protein